jgi:5'-nucleotidase
MIRRAAAAALLLAVACNRQPATFTISLVGTNDLHGGVLEDNGRGGLALLDGYLSNLRAAREADGGAVLLLDAGDLFQGTLESNLNEGSVVVDAYNTIGYHAATIGNHEFDYGPVGPGSVATSPNEDPRGALKARLAQARFPWVASNLLDTNTGNPVQWPHVSPSTTVVLNGVRIGIVGLLTQSALTQTMPANVTDLTMGPLDEALIREARKLRQEGASLVIGVAHAGGACQDTNNAADLESCEPDTEIFRVARALPAGLVDGIVAGHRHARLAHEVNGVPIIESASAGIAFGRIDFTVDRTGRAVSHHVFPPQELCARRVADGPQCAPASATDAMLADYEGRPVNPTARIAAILKPAVDRAAETKARPLGTATITGRLVRTGTPNPVGDLEADWFRALVPGADIAITNLGGLRADLPQGPLTYGRLYALMPFDNQRVVLSMTGVQLRTVMAGNMTRASEPIVISGARVVASCDGQQVRIALRRESGQPIRDHEILKVVTTDFLATGGDDVFAPVMPVHVESAGGPIRDEMATMLTRNGGSWGPEQFRSPRIVENGALACSRR